MLLHGIPLHKEDLSVDTYVVTQAAVVLSKMRTP